MLARANLRPPPHSANLLEDARALKLRVAHLLGTVSFDSPWLSPASTLILRRFADPLRGKLLRDASASMASPEWEGAARAALREQCLRAARPAAGAVPAGANAVLFETPAELLACLARDLSRGDALVRWWWRSWVRGAGVSAGGALLATFRREPRHVPAALAKLAEWGEAERIVGHFRAQEAQQLLREVLWAYELPGLIAALASETRLNYKTPTVLGRDDSATHDTIVESCEAPAAPWEPQVAIGAAFRDLGLAQQILLGVTLLLARAPQRARTLRFETKLRHWVSTQQISETGKPHAVSPADADRSPLPQAQNPQPALVTTPSIADRRVKVIQPGDEILLPERAFVGPTTGGSKPSHEPGATDDSAGEHFNLQEGVATELGGVLFLIPFCRALDFWTVLDSDFHIENPGPWSWLELLARHLLGTDKWSYDPIWFALRSLDGQSSAESPAGSFTGTAQYHLPLTWLRRLTPEGEGILTGSWRRRRVLVRHRDGFLMADCLDDGPLDNSQRRVFLANVVARIPGKWRIGQQPGNARKNLARMSTRAPEEWKAYPELLRFMQFVTPIFRHVLVASLRKRFTRGRDAARELLLRKGKLYVTATHVDLVMEMSSIALNVRMAGLDANPGWVPELGRVVTFHYR